MKIHCRKEFTSSGTALGHQHGRRFFVLVRHIMVYVTSCEKILNICGAFNSVSYYFFLFFVPSLKALQRLAELQSCRVAVYTKQAPRYHRDTKNIPSNVRGQVQRSDKA